MGANSSRRQLNRETQTSLNYFGFWSGAPDGVLGRRSRLAISDYQTHMGYRRSGYLDQFQRDFLISSYYRAISGDQTRPRLTPVDPYRARDLLLTYRNQGDGNTAGNNYGTNPVCPNNNSTGFGVSRRPDLALQWYLGSYDAINGGADAVFAPDDRSRGALVLDAAMRNNGQGLQVQSPSVGGLPRFSVGSEDDDEDEEDEEDDD